MFKIFDIGVYAIYNQKEDKFYVGSSSNIPERLRKHYYDLKTSMHSNGNLQRAYDSYPEQDFCVIPLEQIKSCKSKLKLNLEEAENKWMTLLRKKSKGLYNIQEKAYHGFKPARERNEYFNEQAFNKIKKCLYNGEISFKEAIMRLDKIGYDIKWVKRK